MKIKISGCKIEILRHNFNRLTLKQLREKSESVNLKSEPVQSGHSFLLSEDDFIASLFLAFWLDYHLISWLLDTYTFGIWGFIEDWAIKENNKQLVNELIKGVSA